MIEGRIVVVGGTGFIGRPVVERLAAADRDVVVLSRKRGAEMPPGAEHFPVDLEAPGKIDVPEGALESCRSVIYLASTTPYSTRTRDDAESARRLNVDGLERVLELLAARAPALDGVCYASTIDVYGDPQRIPIDEDHPTAPVSNYGRTKLEAEGLLSQYCSDRAVGLTLLRFVPVFGPGDRSPKLVPSAIAAALAGETPVVHGDGSDLRDLVYLDDAVSAFIHWIETGTFGVFNLATGRSYAVSEIVDTVLRLSGVRVRPKFGPRLRLRRDFIFDATRLESVFGFHASWGLEDGLRATVEWNRRQRAVSGPGGPAGDDTADS